MTFTIHITHCHVEGAGLHNEYYEHDEVCDDYIPIEIDDDTVHSDVAELIYQDYFAQDYARLVEPENRDEARREAKASIKCMLDEYDAWGVPTKLYYDELRNIYEERYNHDR